MTYADHTPNRGEVSGRRPRGLKLHHMTLLENLQDALDRAKIKARVTDIEGRMVTIATTELREYLLAKQECKNRGLEAIRA